MSFKRNIKQKAFPIKLRDSCIKSFLNRRLTEKPGALTAEKKDLVIFLHFLCKLSLDLRTRLRNSISKNLPFCKIRVIFKSSTSISNFSSSKIKCPIVCAITSFTNFRVVDGMLPITAKHGGI